MCLRLYGEGGHILSSRWEQGTLAIRPPQANPSISKNPTQVIQFDPSLQGQSLPYGIRRGMHESDRLKSLLRTFVNELGRGKGV